MRVSSLIIILIASLGAGLGAFSTDAHAKRIKLDESGVPLQAPDHAVDRVAYSYDTEAINKLKALLKKPKSPTQESALLTRLSTLQQERADIMFRIAHAEAYEAKKPINLSQYNNAMKESIQTLDQLISKFPQHRDIPGSYLSRAKAYREIGDRAAAIRDFQYIEKNYPTYPELKSACIELAELAEEAQDYKTAIKYLHYVLRSKKDKDHYPYALYRLAWAHYQLGAVDKALAYVRVHTDYQNQLIKKAEARKEPIMIHQTMRDELLLDSTLFYMKGFQSKDGNYSIASALPYFQKLVNGRASEQTMTGVVVRFTNLLRSEGMATELAAWKEQVVRTLSHRPESLKVIQITFEDQLNKFRYPLLMNTVKDLIELHKISKTKYSFKPAEKLLLDASVQLQNIVMKDKDASSVKEPMMALETVYKGYLTVCDPKEPNRIRIHYNLAEILMAQQKPEEAAAHYRWVFDNAKYYDAKQIAGVNVTESGLKALSITYEDLKKKNVIPKDIVAKKMEDATPVDFPQQFKDWLVLVTTVEQTVKPTERNPRMEFMRFEANRTFYAHGQISEAMKRSDVFVKTWTDSEYALPSARLTIDTLIASQKWAEVEAVCNQYRALKGWKDQKFLKELGRTAADSSYKIAEVKYNAKDHAGVLEQAKLFMATYPESERREDMLSLMGRSAVAMNNEQAAVSTFSTIIDQGPKSKYYEKALYSRAQMAEKRYDYASASHDYRQYLALPESKREIEGVKNSDIQKKILVLAWISGDGTELVKLLKDKQICTKDLEQLCDRYGALVHLNGLGSVHKMRGAMPKANETLWTLNELAERRKRSIATRLELVKAVAEGWSKIDPMFRFTLIPRINEMMNENFRSIRLDVRAANTVRADKGSIQIRVGRIKKVEETAEAILKMPIARIQVSLLAEIAGMYSDLAADIAGIPSPRGLKDEERQVFTATMAKVSEPFNNTGKAFRKKAFEIASRTGVEADLFQYIAKQFFAEQPELAKFYSHGGELPSPLIITAKILSEFDADGGWSEGNTGDKEPVRKLKSEWMNAVAAKHWSKVAYLIAEAHDKKLLSPGIQALMRAVSLSAIGSRAESMGELEEAVAGFQGEQKNNLMLTIIKYYLNTLSREKVLNLVKRLDEGELPSGILSNDERTLVSSWSGAKDDDIKEIKTEKE